MRLVSLWTYGEGTAAPVPTEKPTNVSSTSRRNDKYTGLGYRQNGFIKLGIFNALKKSRIPALKPLVRM